MKNKKLFVALLMIWLVLTSCASSSKLIKNEVRTVLHFVTFRSEPIGADVFVVDTLTGKEMGPFCKTPTRILVMKNKIEIDFITKGISCTEVSPGVPAIAYGKIKMEGAEFQFKFKMPGYYDEMQVIRIPVLNLNDSDIVMQVSLKPMK